jgi:hypothetical protein
MSLNRGNVNPLSVIGLRKLSFIPRHFTKISITKDDLNIKIIDQWINYNLNSRYAIKKTVGLDSNNKLVESVEVGLEDPKELTMFTLGCPHLHTN